LPVTRKSVWSAGKNHEIFAKVPLTWRTDVEQAGLIDGTLYRIAVNTTNVPETRAVDAGLGLVP
jgi:hypothetical protein